MQIVVIAFLVASAGPAATATASSAPPAPLTGESERTTLGERLGSCFAQEAVAAVTCCGSVGLIAFGIATLSVSPVFANVPIPFGVTGIVLGALAMGGGLFWAVAAPFSLFAPSASPSSEASEEADAPDGSGLAMEY